jgi:hypothetical protein
MEALENIPGLHLIDTAAEKTSVLSFVLAEHSNQDITVALNCAGIAVSTGHHSAQPILRRYGLKNTAQYVHHWRSTIPMKKLTDWLVLLNGFREIKLFNPFGMFDASVIATDSHASACGSVGTDAVSSISGAISKETLVKVKLILSDSYVYFLPG